MSDIRVIDSHTGGEPTRLVLAGCPDLGEGSVADRALRFRTHFDAWRSAIVNEPRGSDTMVGALLCTPSRPDCSLGVIFFNNVGLLGMCGHGTIGLVASLAHLGELQPGTLRIDTPVGAVDAQLHENGEVTIGNVPSFRSAKVAVDVPDVGSVRGDIAWGGNWFFLTDEHGRQSLELGDVEGLTQFSWQLRQAVNAQGFPEVDHVELFTPSQNAHSRNFVLCPGKAYDRSPCGTGTSAKLACLAADGKLAEGEDWVQESIIGSAFIGRYHWLDRNKGEIAPSITGRAHVTAQATLMLDPNDPFCWGIRQ